MCRLRHGPILSDVVNTTGRGAMLIATIGLDRLTVDSLRADHPGADVIALPPTSGGIVRARSGPRPDAVVLGHRVADIALERAGVWLGWDEQVVVVAIHRDDPTADVWHGAERHERAYLTPGFLDRFLPAREGSVGRLVAAGAAPAAEPAPQLSSAAAGHPPPMQLQASGGLEWREGMPLEILLLVADEPLRLVLAVTLTTEGHRVEPVAGEAAARAALASRPPDVLLLDATTRLPSELAAWVDRYAPGTPLVVIVPAWSERPEPGRANAVILPMPFGRDVLLQALAEAVQLPGGR
jgi:hypothetical protein